MWLGKKHYDLSLYTIHLRMIRYPEDILISEMNANINVCSKQ